jgi:hypothetical protein
MGENHSEESFPANFGILSVVPFPYAIALVADADGEPRPGGTYTYELRTVAADGEEEAASPVERGQTGRFAIEEGAFVTGGDPELYVASPMVPQDHVINDDLIVNGNACVGFGCADGQSFGSEPLRLKDTHLGIRFEDTSNSLDYPTNDWEITVNDISDGGDAYFAIDDVDGGTTPFRIDAGAPSNSLSMDTYGDIAMGASVPLADLHIVDGSATSVRLERDASLGFPWQVWDLSVNGARFAVWDITNGRIPLKIQAGAPSDLLVLSSGGNVGIGKESPAYRLHIVGDDNPQMRIREQGGGQFKLVAATHVKLGSSTDNDVRFQRNNNTVLTLGSSNRVGIGTVSPGFLLEVNGDAAKPGGGTWSDSSDARLKKDVAAIDGREALDLFAQLQGVTFQWINPEEHTPGTRAGLLAQDLEKVFPDWVDVCEVRGSDADLIPEGEKAKAVHFPHDFNAYTIEAIKALDAENEALSDRVKELEGQVAALEALVEALLEAQSASD